MTKKELIYTGSGIKNQLVVVVVGSDSFIIYTVYPLENANNILEGKSERYTIKGTSERLIYSLILYILKGSYHPHTVGNAFLRFFLTATILFGATIKIMGCCSVIILKASL